MSLERRAAMATLVAGRNDDLLVVPGLGSTTWDLAAAGDNDRNFYLWGAMGGAAMIGLGLALAQPKKRVAVITGDGEEMLMGMGALACTIGIQRPANLGGHRVRQWRLWRNRHAAEPYPKRCRSAQGRGRLRHRRLPRRAR